MGSKLEIEERLGQKVWQINRKSGWRKRIEKNKLVKEDTE